jgi:hypothetical protein
LPKRGIIPPFGKGRAGGIFTKQSCLLDNPLSFPLKLTGKEGLLNDYRPILDKAGKEIE